MNTREMPVSGSPAEQPKQWTVIGEDRYGNPAYTPCLTVQLLKTRRYVLPWDRFVDAAGDSTEVSITFARYRVIVIGAGLEALLDDLATKSVAVIREPMRADLFRANGDRSPIIKSVAVEPWG